MNYKYYKFDHPTTDIKYICRVIKNTTSYEYKTKTRPSMEKFSFDDRWTTYVPTLDKKNYSTSYDMMELDKLFVKMKDSEIFMELL